MNKIIDLVTLPALFGILTAVTLFWVMSDYHRRGEKVPDMVRKPSLEYHPNILTIDTIRYYPCEIDTNYYRGETTYIDNSGWIIDWVYTPLEELSDSVEYMMRYDTLWCRKAQIWLTPYELKRITDRFIRREGE